MALESAAAGARGGGSRGPRWAIGALCLALGAGALGLDLPQASGREFWGDSATYYAMAWSLAQDGDLRFDQGDLARVREEYPAGPQGVFLKRASGGLTVDPSAPFPRVRRVRAEEERLYYAKAIAYPLFVAPFVAVLGTRGFALANVLLLSLALLLTQGILSRRGLRPWPSLAVALALLMLTVTPVYVVWPTPEICGLALITAALASWASGRPLLAAVLFGVAGYLKPPNVLMAAPLGLAPLFPASAARRDGAGLRGRFGESLRRGVVLGLTVAALYGVNGLITGEINYQGGDRKTFYGRFPFDEAGGTFENAGAWMSTNQLGPLVAGKDDAAVTAQTGPARQRSEFREALLLNLGYFWFGRFGGVLAYFFPGFLALVLFLGFGPRHRDGWLALVAVVLSWAFYIRIIPDNWYGGGGTIGNRYFLNVLPALTFLVPVRHWRWVAVAGPAAALVFLGPPLVSPVRHSLAPGEQATRGVYRLLPPELTMLNDLAVFTEPWRKKRPYGFVGNAERGADADAFFLYFLDDGTWGRERWGGREGFWMRGDGPAEVVVRAFDLAPVDRIVLRLAGGPMGDVVEARVGWHRQRVRLGPGETREISLPVGRGVLYYDTYLHRLHLHSRRSAPLADGRPVGVFVEPRLTMGRFAPR